MKVLIIGASGRLARPVIKELSSNGYQLRLFSRTIEENSLSDNIEVLRGDLFHPADLLEATTGCDAVHINLSRINESNAVKQIVKFAKMNNINLISYISGCTVCEENSWFPMIKNKYEAENAIKESGIDYIIFRPTWFFESLPLMIKNGKAVTIGNKPNSFRWIAADDYARMVVTAYKMPEAKNRTFNIYGNQYYRMKDLLAEYCQENIPIIEKVTVVPTWIMKIVANVLRNSELKNAVELFSYFEKVKEPGNSIETNKLLGKPQIDFKKWLELNGVAK